MGNFTNEVLILSSLIKDSDYASRVIPFLKGEYFTNKIERVVLQEIKKHINEYHAIPNKAILLTDVRSSTEFNQLEYETSVDFINEIFQVEQPNSIDWLVRETEKFCINKATYLAIMKSISIYDGSVKDSPNTIPEMMRDAISISFDTTVGMDLAEDAEKRWEFYTSPTSKIPFDIELLNEITNGGTERKTLNLILAAIHGGKTMLMCHLASAYVKMGYNVLYVSLEMREENIGKRIDANILDVPMDDLSELSKESFLTKMHEVRSKSFGRMKIKEFPPSSVSSIHIRNLLNELDLKQNFKPDIVLVDYLGILNSDRSMVGQNSHYQLKAVSEELRAIAVDFDLVMWSACQTTRQGQQDMLSVEMTDVAESIGVGNTADFFIAVARSEDLDSLGQVQLKQLKNRYKDKTKNTKIYPGVSLEKQRFFDPPDVREQLSSELEREKEEKVNMARNNGTSIADRFSKLKT